MDDEKEEVGISQRYLENVRKSYVELTNLCIDSMLIQLYAKGVITDRDKEMIETSRLRSDKMVYFLDSVIIRSLKNNVTVKFKGFLQVMVGSDDQLLINMAEKLGIAPVITCHPSQDIQIQRGHKVTLEVTAFGTKPLQFQWYYARYYEYNIIDGENRSFYSIFPVTTKNTGCYYCQIKNQYGEVNSTTTTLTVTMTPAAQHSSENSRFTYTPNILPDKEPAVPQVQEITPSANLRSTSEDSQESMESTFSTFVDKICDELKKGSDFIKVRRKCIQNVNVTGTISLPKDTLNEIRNAKEFDELFDILCFTPYWNWMNIRMLERMAADCSAAQQVISQYKNEVFCRKVKDVVSEIPSLEIPADKYTEVKGKWNKDFDNLIVKDIVEQWNEIEKKFNVEETMLLKSITEGCVEICWLIPNDLVERAIDSATINQPVKHEEHSSNQPPVNHQSGSSTQEFFSETLFLKIGNVIIKDDVITTDTLANYYIKEEIVPLQYDLPTCRVEHYTPLTIFCYKEKYTKSQAMSIARTLTLTGIITHKHYGSSSVYEMLTENISDLFTFFEKITGVPYIILIEGIAGIGKTTLCKEIALQWANKIILKNKNLFFLLFMHDPKLKNIVNIESLVKHFYHSEILSNKIIDVLKATDGKYLTIVIDGYSEDSENSFITDCIIGRKILVKCDVVITSRSPASSHLSKIINHRALVLGFIKSNQINFIDTALKDSDSNIDHLKNYLCSNTIISNLCYIPLIMNFLPWFVAEEISDSVKNQSDLVQKYIMMVIKKKNITSMTDLPYPYQVIKDLSQFAFTAVQEDKLTFMPDEILESCENHFQVNQQELSLLDIIYELGLLNVISFETQSVCYEIYHFGHVAIQEYLAANYISFLSDSELLELLHGTFWTIRYFNVWIMYVGITGGKCSAFKSFLSANQPFGGSRMSISNKLDYCLYQFQCLQEADGDLNDTLLGQDIDLKHQKLSHKHLHTLTVLLSRSPNKKWQNLNLSSCSIDTQGCTILYEMFHSNIEVEVETVDVSYNNFHWESLHAILGMLKAWHTKRLALSINALYDTVTTSVINNFTDALKESFQNDIFSDEILLITYLPKKNKLVAVYLAPIYIKWFQWTDCKLNEDAIKQIKVFVERNVRKEKFKIAFSYSIIDDQINVKKLSLLHSDMNIQLRGSYLHSKGAYLANIASTIDYQYNSPQQLVADYLAAVLCYDIQSTTSYLESLSAAYAIEVKNSLHNALSMRTFYISRYFINSQNVTNIEIILSLMGALRVFYTKYKNLNGEITIKIEKSLQNVSTLTVFGFNNNNFDKEVADDIAMVLSQNTKLNKLYLHNNNFETAGMIKIAKALQHTSTLTALSIGNNNPGEEAADDIATVLSRNIELQELYLDNNNLKTAGIIKISRALQNLTTLTVFSIGNNKVGEEAADDVCAILSLNNKLETICLCDNNFKTVGIIKIAKALQSTSILKVLDIGSNSVGEEAADDISIILSQNTELQKLYLYDNNFKTVGMIKIAKALQNTSTLKVLHIGSNDIGKQAANDIAEILSYNTELNEIYLYNNNFKTTGMIKIAKALQNISTLTALSIGNNNVGEEAADDITMVLSCNTELQELYLSNNNLKTAGMIKISRGLLHLSTLTVFNIGNNKVGEEAVDDVCVVLSQNNKLETLCLYDNNFKTVGMIKIAKALQSTSVLKVLNIGSNSVGEEAADDISTILSQNTKLQKLYLYDNDFKTVGMIKIAKALQNTSSLKVLNIGSNDIGEQAADDIAKVLSYNTELNEIYLYNNNFKTTGMMKLGKALQNTSNLKVFSIGGNDIGEQAADDIGVVLSHNPKLKIAHLYSNNFKTVGIIKIAETLQNVSTLTVFDISNNRIGEEAADKIATVLYHNTELQELCLNDNRFKTLGMIKITKALHNISTLTVFSIGNNNVGEEAADEVATVLSHNVQLQALCLHGNGFKTAGMIKIAKSLQNVSTLTVFSISDNNVGEEAADEVATVLSHNTKLKELYLNKNNFKTVGIIKIVKALQNISTLEILNLHTNNVGEEAADNIATVLSHNTKIEDLNLSNNSFKAVGMIKIIKALQNISTLKVFHNNNNCIGEEAADDIATVLFHNTNLQSLYLYNNNLKTAGMIKIANALQNVSTLIEFNIGNNDAGEEAADDIAAVLSHNTKLQKLNFCKNNFKTSGMIKITKSLQNISTLTVLNISKNDIGEEAANDIARVVAHNSQMQRLSLCDNFFQASGIIKITEALKNTPTLVRYNITGNDIKEQTVSILRNILSWNTKLDLCV